MNNGIYENERSKVEFEKMFQFTFSKIWHKNIPIETISMWNP